MSNTERATPMYISVDGQGITLDDFTDRIMIIHDCAEGLQVLLKAGLDQNQSADDTGIFHTALCVVNEGIRKEALYLWPDKQASSKAAVAAMLDSQLDAGRRRIAELEASQAEREEPVS